MTVLETFRLIAPEFVATQDAMVNGVIELVSPMVSESKVGKL